MQKPLVLIAVLALAGPSQAGEREHQTCIAWLHHLYEQDTEFMSKFMEVSGSIKIPTEVLDAAGNLRSADANLRTELADYCETLRPIRPTRDD